MKIFKLASLLFLFIFPSSILFSQRNAIEVSDIQNLIGEWKGTLMYNDYTSGNLYSMPCNVTVKSKRKNRKLVLCYEYPNEPKANNKNKIRVAKDGTTLNGKPIISRYQTSDGNIKITTEYPGQDGNENKSALIRNIYTIGPNTFIIRKEVQFLGTQEWLTRNEFLFKKK